MTWTLVLQIVVLMLVGALALSIVVSEFKPGGKPGPKGEDGAQGVAGPPGANLHLRMIETPSPEHPHGSECPLHGEVHGAHGWYYCVLNR